MALSSDETIEGVLPTVYDREDYVRGIRASFGKGFDRTKAVVRIGVSGTGKAPHYCIEQGSIVHELKAFSVRINAHEYRTVFNGRSHNPILEDQWKGLAWSSVAASFDEVLALLRKLRPHSKHL